MTTEERPGTGSATPTTPETSGFRNFVVLLLLVTAFPFLIQYFWPGGDALENLKVVPTQEEPSTLVSRDGVYISEAITDDPAEQEEIDQAFDVFSGRSGGLEFDVLSLWDVYQYLVVEKHRPQYYTLSFSNSPPIWRTDEKAKRRELHIDGPQMRVEVRNEKTYESNEPWPNRYLAHMVKVGVNMGGPENIPPKEGWIRLIATKDFLIQGYGKKYRGVIRERQRDFLIRTNRTTPETKRIWTSIVP